MSLSQPIQPITASDDEIAQALADAHLPSLLPALAQITGDLSLLRDELRPDTTSLLPDPSGFVGGAAAAEAARALALGVLARFRDGGCKVAPPPDRAFLRAILAWFAPDGAIEPYLPIVEEELSVSERDLRAPGWSKQELAPERPFSVAVIGAGMSGLLIAYRLRQAGVDFTIFEKNDDVGGTWYDNTYPGCRVDVANSFYSYSFAQKADWPQHFSTQPVLLDYFRDCAEAFGVRERIRFRSEVLLAEWDDERALWRVRVRTADGREEVVEANAVVSAVGQLNVPKLPDIPGRERFEGPSFHSARWDHSVPLAGRRVAVIGTGASSAQFVPVIAEEAARLDVFQRTPNWMLPVEQYHAEIPAGQRWILTHVPSASHWHRFWLFWRLGDGMFLPRARVDRSWPDLAHAVSASNEEMRNLLTLALKMQVLDRPDLAEKIVPDYPPASKRILVDNGAWIQALKRPNVHLITDAIREITERGVVTKDGALHEADVIVYGTGFQASKFLTPMRVVGRGGVDLHEQWAGNARAYLGVTIPSFPNFFCMYGPNTNIVVNGSIIYFSECEARYITSCLRLVLAGGHRALDCRKDVHDAYNAWVDEGNLSMAWGVAKVNSWYKSESGRVAQNWPFTLLEYWQKTRDVRPSDYETID
ncbi:MAG: NAD(P)/FAD-dependent oxidoreductase [Proteobacteria bacterium]|nr:MAG: NAD(P)/FAD-dependent oxidoreductase [Pseudomonadota bacterium]